MLTSRLSEKALRSDMGDVAIKTLRNSQTWKGKCRNEKLADMKCNMLTSRSSEEAQNFNAKCWHPNSPKLSDMERKVPKGKISEIKCNMLTSRLSEKALRSDMEDVDIKALRNSQTWNGRPRNEKTLRNEMQNVDTKPLKESFQKWNGKRWHQNCQKLSGMKWKASKWEALRN